MRYRLVAIDLTGTLLEPDGELDPLAVDLIGRAQDLSVRFALVTGLPPTTAAIVARRLDVAAFLIGYAGAITQSPGDRDTLASRPLEPDVVRAALALGSGRGLATVAGYADRLIAAAPAALGQPLGSWLLTTPPVVADLATAVAGQPEPPLALLYFGEPAELAALADACRRDPALGARLTAISINPNALELVASGVSKGAALAALCHRLGIARADTIAIGDSTADMDFLAAAGLGCAVANAAEALRAAAGYVATSPRGQGVAEVIERFVLHSAD